MNILVTGAGGFIGKNLVAALKNRRDGKDRTRDIPIGEIFEYTRADTPEKLAVYGRKADFVFHLAGVNRPEDPAEFMRDNAELTARLLEALRAADNRCPVMLASSVQAALDNAYGASKRAAEQLVFAHGHDHHAPVLVYRFPNVFGKWCRPNYNSVVATFCHSIAREQPIRVDDPAAELELVYIDDLVDELLDALEGREHRKDGFCFVPTTCRVTLGQIEALLRRFHAQPQTLLVPEIPAGSFEKKLYSTYLSYLPPEQAAFPLRMRADARGSFTELIKTVSGGQVSVNVSRPGVTKGEHWHRSKWEFFVVVSGHGLIRMRPVTGGETVEFEVDGERMQCVHMLPGYTHSITNLSRTDDLVTVMWADEPFDPEKPDTYFEEV